MKAAILTAWTVLAAIVLTASPGLADEPVVSAALSSDRVVAGQVVRLTVTVEGTRDVGNPPPIAVDGLRVQSRGRSMQFQMRNFDARFVTTFTYAIQPERAGTFTIPALEIEAGGKVLRTDPLELEVVSGGRPPAGPPGQPGADDPGRDADAVPGDLFFAELIVPRESAYVGETVPVEIRLYFDSRIDYQPEGLPEFDSTDFTMKAMPDPRRERVRVGGRPYDVLVFNTALTPLKPGPTEIGPVRSTFLVRIPQESGQGRGNSFFDNFFDDPFFGSPFQRSTTQRVRLTAEASGLDVLPLPEDGRPESFQGAVGTFRMDVTLDNPSTEVGSPLTLQATIAGRGDFDRVRAPELTETDGWRTYPPSSDFTANDTLGISGTKTFQILTIPEEGKSELPPLEFSYFDPARGEYRTLRSEAMPITVSGSPAPAPAAGAAAADAPGGARDGDDAGPRAAGGEAAGAEPPSVGRDRDILHIDTSPQDWTARFTPFYKTRDFWMIQLGVLVLALLALAAWIVQSRRMDARRLRRLAARQRLMKARATALSEDEDAERRIEAFVSWLRQQTEIVHGRPAALVDAAEVLRTRPDLASSVAEDVRSLFHDFEESRYGGRGARRESDSTGRIARAVEAIETYDADHN